ncbi:MAG: Xaa-Pro peptidase family protein [Planctomycetes bacterium]|nr:Xaa-Pro peptidase family protein [Planctomycetota bacterium]
MAATKKRTTKPARSSSKIAIDRAEFARRRAALLESLRGSVGLVLAGEADPNLHHPYAAHAHFFYLTGIANEPGASLLLDPKNPNPARRIQLFLRPLNPEREKWDGFRPEIGGELRALAGIETLFRTNMLPQMLLDAAKRVRSLTLLMPLSAYNSPVSGDLEIFRRVAERIPTCGIVDGSAILNTMRARKSKAEAACIQEAGRITALGFDAAFAALRPGMNEFELQRHVESAYHQGGSRELAFRTIAGGGFNSTVLHYHDNDQMLRDGELVCLDSGAKWCGYSADVTRTLPVSGTFSPRQRKIHDLVLESQAAAIRACKPGARFHQIDEAARSVLRRAGLADAFIHGIGHHLGLETHDANPDAPLQAGAVVTIEPGVYLPDEHIGVRIEDDVLITARGAVTLTRGIPRSSREIEAAMAKSRRPRKARK